MSPTKKKSLAELPEEIIERILKHALTTNRPMTSHEYSIRWPFLRRPLLTCKTLYRIGTPLLHAVNTFQLPPLQLHDSITISNATGSATGNLDLKERISIGQQLSLYDNNYSRAPSYGTRRNRPPVQSVNLRFEAHEGGPRGARSVHNLMTLLATLHGSGRDLGFTNLRTMTVELPDEMLDDCWTKCRTGTCHHGRVDEREDDDELDDEPEGYGTSSGTCDGLATSPLKPCEYPTRPREFRVVSRYQELADLIWRRRWLSMILSGRLRAEETSGKGEVLGSGGFD